MCVCNGRLRSAGLYSLGDGEDGGSETPNNREENNRLKFWRQKNIGDNKDSRKKIKIHTTLTCRYFPFDENIILANMKNQKRYENGNIYNRE